jgi:hypothetical protein
VLWGWHVCKCGQAKGLEGDEARRPLRCSQGCVLAGIVLPTAATDAAVHVLLGLFIPPLPSLWCSLRQRVAALGRPGVLWPCVRPSALWYMACSGSCSFMSAAQLLLLGVCAGAGVGHWRGMGLVRGLAT